MIVCSAWSAVWIDWLLSSNARWVLISVTSSFTGSTLLASREFCMQRARALVAGIAWIGGPEACGFLVQAASEQLQPLRIDELGQLKSVQAGSGWSRRV